MPTERLDRSAVATRAAGGDAEEPLVSSYIGRACYPCVSGAQTMARS